MNGPKNQLRSDQGRIKLSQNVVLFLEHGWAHDYCFAGCRAPFQSAGENDDEPVDQDSLNRLAMAAAAIGLAFGIAGPAHADGVVTNGSFETGDFTGWTLTGNTGFTGVECPGAPFAGPGDGNCDAFLGPVGLNGTLSQILTTVPGWLYNINFDFQPDGGQTSFFSAVWDAQPALFGVTNLPASAYQVLHFTAMATTTTTLLSFNFRDDPGFLKLDSVSVTPAPEPGSMALLGIGMAGLWWRRRKAQ